ncbi:hypothetical protein CAEBREN_29695 [Caenorhabditis brenneri]|uniref:Endonuclease/exonuclease/phosphatase domain-containing protein n=1 Tax=Caenorhabditis brenneri TaxID=135651 RepID=G0MPL1_CAEBE|nr:hypothetical protein CAEBREN_29695 [Caenorhabditis brenneri]
MCEPRKGAPRMVVICGDFNAAVGTRQHAQELGIGPQGFGTRNPRGQAVLDFCATSGFSVANTYCKQRSGRKWSWRAPNGKLKREYDLCLVKSPKQVRNVHAMNGFQITSDHRMVKVILVVEKRKRQRYYRPQKQCTDWEKYRRNVEEMNVESLENMNVTGKYEKLCELLADAKQTATTKETRKTRFSSRTLDLFKTRSSLLNNQDPMSQIQLIETSKLLRITIRDDLERSKLKKYEKALANRRVNEPTTTQMMWEILKTDGTLTTNSEELCKAIKAFYEDLYSSTVKTERKSTRNSEIPPEILTSEVEYNLHRMKRRKAPGQDKISCAMLRNAEEVVIPHLKEIYNEIIQTGNLPPLLANSVTTLVFKKESVRHNRVESGV